jgi:protein-S-isoprenylcysteine O-methyltransferase Ste14
MTQGSKLLDYAFIVLAIVFGAGSVLLLVIGEPIRIVHFNWLEQNILLWDTFLSLLFFAQHRITIRKFFRQRVKMIFSPHYDIAIYATTSGIALTIVVLFWQRSQVSLLNLQGISRLFVSTFSFLGVFLFILAASMLRPFDPLGIGPIRAHLREMKYQQGPFIIHGPYRWVRHPLYACILVMFWANPDMTTDQLLFNVMWSGWIIVATFLEERDLIREFGDVYKQYQKSVPMLIPWKSPYPIIN